MSLLFYKRPNYVGLAPGPTDTAEYERQLEMSRKAIPSELSFEMVVSNRAMPPCSLQDFMGYLLNVSHDAENLQFYLWLQDYTERFHRLSRNEQALSPPWNQDDLPHQAAPFADTGPRLPEKTMIQAMEAMDCKFDFDNRDMAVGQTDDAGSIMSGSLSRKTVHSVDFANQQTGLKWQSFTIQPFRAEINKVIATYIAPGSPRELNLSYKNRNACLHALQHTTHPSAFEVPSRITAQNLRDHSHPKFIRWSTANGNRPRIIFGRMLGALNILFGFLIAILLLLSTASRWWRIWAFVAWFLGFSFLLAGANGICLVLYITHDRHLRPWEQFPDESSSSFGADSLSTAESGLAQKHFTAFDFEDKVPLTAGGGPPANSNRSDIFSLSQPDTLSSSKYAKSGRPKARLALEAFGTANSRGHEVWVEKYRTKMLIRKVFDRTVWVANEQVRIVQDRVALQALLWAGIVSVPLTIMFVAVPGAGVIH